MYSIGEFSRITGLTIKALRLYHDKGLIIPGYVDESSGYRYYSESDTEKARAVVALKSMRCSLAEIELLFDSYTEDSDLVDFLQAKQRSLQSELEQLKSVSIAIDIIVRKESEVRDMQQDTYEIESKVVAPQEVVANRWKGRYDESGKVFGKLYRAAGRHAAGAVMNLYYDDEYKEGDADIESCLPVKKVLAGKVKSKTMAGGEVLSLMHRGAYDSLGESYKKLFDYLKQQGKEAQLPIREIYHKGPGMIFKGRPEKYLTEIQVVVV